MPSATQRAGTRAAVYSALAEALVEPQDQLVDVLITASARGTWDLGSRTCERTLEALTALLPMDLGVLLDQYRRTMNPAGRRPPALYESLHRHGHLMGEASRAVERWYRPLGVAPAQGELPDHAGVELAFLAGLAAAEGECTGTGPNRLRRLRLRQTQKMFLREHAGTWLPELGTSLIAAGQPFYVVVGDWLGSFVAEEIDGRNERRSVGPLRPTLDSDVYCTLCGLCSRSCPVHALLMVEDDQHTALLLDRVRCTGCSRCVSVCPEAILAMQTQSKGRVPASDLLSLKESPRQACPKCGRPTVSQAEMIGVLTRLQADAELASRLSLCPQCKALN